MPFLTLTACASTPRSAPRASASTKSRMDLAKDEEIEAEEALTADEYLLMEALRTRVRHLSTDIGERNSQKSWDMAEAADYIAVELEGMGFPLERQGYETAEVAAQNIAVTVQGGTRGDEILVVAAHYDTRQGSRGWNEGASPTAALLELARLMRDAKLNRTLRLVFFAMGEAPHGDDEARGARHYGRKFAAALHRSPEPGLPEALHAASEIRSLGVVLLDRLGSFSGEGTQSQQRSRSFQVQLRASPGAEKLNASLETALSGAPFLIRQLTFDETVESDGSALWEQGLSSVVVQGDGRHLAGDASVQYDRMAQVVMRLRHGIGQLVGEIPTNDGMLTPLSGKIR